MKSLRAKLLLLAASLIVSLVLAEIGLRLFVEQETKRLATYDPDLGWRGRPYGTGLYVRHRDKIRVPFHYNRHGFRDDSISSRQGTERRVVMLGDSFVEGMEVDAEFTFHELVERQLRQKAHPDARVIAIASQGYSTAQQLIALRKFQQPIDADIVLTAFYTGNDFQDNTRRKFAYLDEAGELVIPPNRDGWPKRQARALQRWAYESSHVVFLAKNFIQSHTSLKLTAPSKQESDEDEAYQHDVTKALLLATQREVESAGGRYGLIVIPSRDEILAGDLSRVAAVAEFCRQAEIPCLELSLVLRSEHYFKTDEHLNIEGHRAASDEIFRFVISLGEGS